MNWQDPAEMERATALYYEMPAAEAARRLGVTKNALIGAMNRAGVIKRESPPRPPAMLSFPPADGCLWPIGDPDQPDFHFCGAPKIPGSRALYCLEHTDRAYLKL